MMKQRITPKEYQKLIRAKNKTEKLLKLFLMKYHNLTFARDLLDLTKLKLKGGPKDLSLRFDFYLYERNETLS